MLNSLTSEAAAHGADEFGLLECVASVALVSQLDGASCEADVATATEGRAVDVFAGERQGPLEVAVQGAEVSLRLEEGAAVRRLAHDAAGPTCRLGRSVG